MVPATSELEPLTCDLLLLDGLEALRSGNRSNVDISTDTPDIDKEGLELSSRSDEENAKIDTVLEREKLPRDRKSQRGVQVPPDVTLTISIKLKKFLQDLRKARIVATDQSRGRLELPSPCRTEVTRILFYRCQRTGTAHWKTRPYGSPSS
jgi:hypothetical protein